MLSTVHPDFTVNLQYRASQHGYNAKDFHQRCDGKGPTLTLVRASTGRTFGAYTDQEWASDDKYKSSSKSFLFSIDLEEKYELKPGHEQYSSRSAYNLGPCFGGGYDLRLSDNFQNNQCSGYIGFSYETKKYDKGALVTRYPADVYGHTFFTVNEIEVFHVQDFVDDGEGPGKINPNNNHGDDDDGGLFISIIKDNNNNNNNSNPYLDNILNNQNNNNNNQFGFPQSNILQNQDFAMVYNWIGGSHPKAELLYRGSSHGFGSSNFHQECDDKGPTLTVVRTKGNKAVFGGYTKISWN
mmetsp:Transcript_23722/g.20609  ORF Transcript_23722/g.20609 Transcript_23722/m.20609 type:complete len:297 (+) Transcript_23722:394-1284(+)